MTMNLQSKVKELLCQFYSYPLITARSLPKSKRNNAEELVIMGLVEAISTKTTGRTLTVYKITEEGKKLVESWDIPTKKDSMKDWKTRYKKEHYQTIGYDYIKGGRYRIRHPYFHESKGVWFDTDTFIGYDKIASEVLKHFDTYPLVTERSLNASMREQSEELTRLRLIEKIETNATGEVLVVYKITSKGQEVLQKYFHIYTSSNSLFKEEDGCWYSRNIFIRSDLISNELLKHFYSYPLVTERSLDDSKRQQAEELTRSRLAEKINTKASGKALVVYKITNIGKAVVESYEPTYKPNNTYFEEEEGLWFTPNTFKTHNQLAEEEKEENQGFWLPSNTFIRYDKITSVEIAKNSDNFYDATGYSIQKVRKMLTSSDGENYSFRGNSKNFDDLMDLDWDYLKIYSSDINERLNFNWTIMGKLKKRIEDGLVNLYLFLYT